jgi:hypothetical protein
MTRSMAGMGRATDAKDEWLTPPDIIDALGPFDLDPCSPVDRPWPTARQHFTYHDDGLERDWIGRVWLNPPYARVGDWMARLGRHGAGTALVFARTETEWFFSHVWPVASAVLFMRRRIHFHSVDGVRAPYNAGAPSVLVAYGIDDADRLAEAAIDGAFIPLACRGQIIAVLRGPEAPVSWRQLVQAVVAGQGGQIALSAAYMLIDGHPKAEGNQHWRAKVRQVLQGKGFERTGPAQYAMEI